MGLKIKYYEYWNNDIENMNEDMINKCYRKEATRRHPDKNGGNNDFISYLKQKIHLILFMLSLKKHVRMIGLKEMLKITKGCFIMVGMVMKKDLMRLTQHFVRW